VVKRGVGAEGQTTRIFAFNVDQQFLVLGFQAVQDFGIHDDANVMNIGLDASQRATPFGFPRS